MSAKYGANKRKSHSPRTIADGLRLLAYVPQTLKLLWRAAPGWVALSSSMVLVQGLLPVATVFLTRRVVDQLVIVLESQNAETYQPALLSMALLVGVLLTQEILKSLTSFVRVNLSERVQDSLSLLIHEQASALDLQFYDSAHYYDILFRASVDALERPLSLLEGLTNLAQSAITLLAMAGILTLFGWWMPLILLVGTLPALWVAVRTTLAFHRWRRGNTINERRLRYFQLLLIKDDAAAEMRLFNLSRRFQDAYHALRATLRRQRVELARQQMVGQIGAGALGLVSIALALAFLAWQALQGLYSLGDLAMFYQAMNQGQRLMHSSLTSLGEVYRNVLFLEDLFAFLALTPAVRDPEDPRPLPLPLRRGIQFDSVSFSYPDSERSTLTDFSLFIPAGKTTAIVGENGAGKSTLLKLLCRLYDPTGGCITWDGIDLRDLRQEELRRHITVLFQQPVAYHETAATNIALGDLSRTGEQDAIQEAARMGGAESVIEKLPRGYETVLGKWFGQAELSVGEWQRLALSRAFLRQAELIVLDEPTSAMDSWAEHAWMERFQDLVAGRTAVIITHRFSTAMRAEQILVMVDGRIVESGSHEQLVAEGGRYAQSWRRQMAGRNGANPVHEATPAA